jgi:hypothetical protein
MMPPRVRRVHVPPADARRIEGMAKVITQRTLRNESGEIMRGLDRGESYIVTRNGVWTWTTASTAPKQFRGRLR